MIDLRASIARALASIDVGARVRAALASRVPRRVLAVGKGAGAMADAALDACSGSITDALVVLPDAAPAPRADPRVRVLRAAHPLPDVRSVAAGEAALALRADLALVSGGASSLLFAPWGDLGEARAAFAALLDSGADVRAINVVRRHASRVHGGHAGIADTLLVSDVLGGAPHDVGSGPTVPDPTTVGDARAVLARYAPRFAALTLVETVKPVPIASRVCTILVEPGDLPEALGRDLTLGGFAVRVLPASTADVRALADEIRACARSLAPGEAVTRSAEPSVHVDVPSPGAGGRCAHLAALVACDLPPDVTFLAGASDGVDGGSGTAGAVVTADSFPDRQIVARAVAAFNTGPLHLAYGTALPRAPTGINLADVHALVRAR